ncbi:MAG TPA: GTP 3',8-cyclase MoaA [Planctomycetes bacterium]|nr:GTP 3',8-cyclase MoaA [Planctomycetota bacterium]
MTARDRHQRPLRSLRISVTDRCNLRCGYCMPEEDYVWLPRSDILDLEEVARLARVFAGLGVRRFRLTGGEPLLRRNLVELVRLLRAIEGVEDLALTTNAILLPRFGEDLRAAGLDRITVSLDSLDPERFARLSGRPRLDETLAGIEAARELGFPVKLNTVVLAGQNEDELPALLDFARAQGAELRLIEYMDVGGATRWSSDAVVSRADVLRRLEASHGAIRELGGRGSAPAERFALSDGTVFGVIASTTQPFCGACDRARLTADGRLFLCLYAREGHDLRAPLRAGEGDAQLSQRVATIWGERLDRGAEERRALATRRRPLALAGELRADPHLEMHTRGG